MNEQCTQFPVLGEPSPLRSTSESPICEACIRAGKTAPVTLDGAAVPVEEEHKELLRAAIALLDNEISDEDR